MIKRSLSHAFHPPAPIVPVKVQAPGGTKGRPIESKIDTGADLCTIPEGLVAELGLPWVRTMQVSGYAGRPQPVRLYQVDLQIGDMQFPQVEVVPSPRPYGLIGRNLLQHLLLRIDGPAETLQLSRPRG